MIKLKLNVHSIGCKIFNIPREAHKNLHLRQIWYDLNLQRQILISLSFVLGKLPSVSTVYLLIVFRYD